MDHSWKHFEWGNNAFVYSICSVCELIKSIVSEDNTFRYEYYLEYKKDKFGMSSLNYVNKASCSERLMKAVLE